MNILILLSNLLEAIGFITYIRAILTGKAKPQRMTRFVIMVIVGVAFASLWAAGERTTIWLIGLSFFFTVIMFVLSIPFGMGGMSKLDFVCLSVAFIGIVLWRVTNNPLAALFSSIFADFVGCIPMLVKTYHHPETEDPVLFLLSAVASFLTILAAPDFAVESVSYPLYLIGINTAMVYMIRNPQK